MPRAARWDNFWHGFAKQVVFAAASLTLMLGERKPQAILSGLKPEFGAEVCLI